MASTKQPVAQSSDYELCAVPLNERKSFFSLTIVWTGFVFVITSMMAGGGLAAGLDFKSIIFATLLGNLFLSTIAILVSIIACKTGLTFALITRYSFGAKGTRVASLFVPIVNIGWYTIQSATYGHFISQIFGFGPVAEGITMMLSALAMGVFALIGMNAIYHPWLYCHSVHYLSVPCNCNKICRCGGRILGHYRLYSLGSHEPCGRHHHCHWPWILSTATCIADIMRYAKNVRQAILSAFVGLVGGNSLLVLCDAISSIAVGNSDLTGVLLTLGLVIPSIILMTTNIFTTNASNLYSTSLNLSNAFHMNRKVLISIILGISALCTLTKPYQIDSLFTFLNLLGVIVPPLAGIILSDFYLVHKGVYEPLDEANLRNWTISPWLTWILSYGVVVVLEHFHFGLNSLNGILAAVVIYPLLAKGFKEV